MASDTGHAFEEHTAEVQIRLWAPTLPRLFEEAALALAEVMAGTPVPASGQVHEHVALAAGDRDALLADWLNELLFRTEMSARLQTAVRIDEFNEHSLTGMLGSTTAPRPVNPVKAATMHGLRIVEKPEGCSATVILDV